MDREQRRLGRRKRGSSHCHYASAAFNISTSRPLLNIISRRITETGRTNQSEPNRGIFSWSEPCPPSHSPFFASHYLPGGEEGEEQWLLFRASAFLLYLSSLYQISSVLVPPGPVTKTASPRGMDRKRPGTPHQPNPVSFNGGRVDVRSSPVWPRPAGLAPFCLSSPLGFCSSSFVFFCASVLSLYVLA